MCFRLQRYHGLDFLCLVEIRFLTTCRGELLDYRAIIEGYVIFICRNQLVRILGRSLLNQAEERAFLLLAIDNKRTTENLVAAMLGIDLRETEHLAIRQLTPQLLAHFLQVSNLFRAQGQPFLLVVCLQVFDIDDGVGLLVDSKDGLVQSVVNTLQHRVVFRLARCDGEVLFDTGNTVQTHVLCYFHRIGTPRRYHLAARTDKPSFQCLGFHRLGFTKEPHQLLHIFRRKLMLGFYGQHGFC